MANSLELPGGIKILNPVPSDPRNKVTSLASIANDSTYYVGFSPIYAEDGGATFMVSGGNATDGWTFREIAPIVSSTISVGDPSPVSSNAVALEMSNKPDKDALVFNNLIFDSNLQDTEPANGEFKFVGTGQQQSSIVLMSKANAKGVPISAFGNITVGSTLYLETIVSVRESLFITVENVVEESNYYRIGFTRATQTDNFLDGREVSLVIKSVSEVGFTEDVIITKAIGEDVNAAIAALPNNGNGYSLIIQLEDGVHADTLNFNNMYNVKIIIEAQNALSATGYPNSIINVGNVPAITFSGCYCIVLIDSISITGSSDINDSEISILSTGGFVRVLDKFCKFFYAPVLKDNYIYYGVNHLESRGPTLTGSSTHSVHMVKLSNATDNDLAGLAFCYDAVLDTSPSTPFFSFATGNGICAVKNSPGVFDNVVNPGSNAIDLLAAAPVDIFALTDISVTNITQTGLRLTVTNNQGYGVYWGVYAAGNVPELSDIISGINAIVFGGEPAQPNVPEVIDITGLQENTPYDLFVVGSDEAFNYTKKYLESFTTAATQLTPLTAPVLSAGAVTDSSIELNWTDPVETPNEQSFRLEWSADGVTGWTLETILGSDFINRVVTVPSGTLRYFRIQKEGNGTTTSDSPWSNVVSETTTGSAVTAPTVTTQAVTSITDGTAVGNGNIVNTGGETITAWGIVMSESINPTTDDTVFAGSGTGEVGYFTANLTGLAPETTYYVRAYATNAVGTGYHGPNITFTTESVPATAPTVTTLAPTGVNLTDATFNADLTSLGDETSVNVGFEYSENNPPASGNTTSFVSQSATGQFSASVTDLVPGNTYYVRAFAVGNTTEYGNVVSFVAEIPANAPTVTTQAVSDITATGGTGNGNITADGGATITAWGICAGTSPVPTTADTVFAGSGTGTVGAFTAAITGLTAETNYHVRAFATNSEGTSYGANVTFTTDVSGLPALNAPVLSRINATATTAGLQFPDVNTSPNGVSFVIEQEIVATPGFSQIATLGQDVTDYSLTGLTPETAYRYRIMEIGDGVTASNSPWSNIVEVTTLALDTTRPVITGFRTSLLNDYAILTLSENVFKNNDATGAITASDLIITDTAFGATATGIAIGAVTSMDDSPALGTNELKIALTWTGTPDGTDTFEIKPAVDNSFYDRAGNGVLSTETTGTITSWVVGNEMIANNDFATDTLWEYEDTLTISGGNATFNGWANLNLKMQGSLMNKALSPNTTYTFLINLTAVTDATIGIYNYFGLVEYVAPTAQTTGTIPITFTTPAVLSNDGIRISIASNGGNEVVIESVSLKEN